MKSRSRHFFVCAWGILASGCLTAILGCGGTVSQDAERSDGKKSRSQSRSSESRSHTSSNETKPTSQSKKQSEEWDVVDGAFTPTNNLSEGSLIPATEVQNKTPPQPVYRPEDARPRHNEEFLARLGIRKFESKRLILFTDIDPEKAQALPSVIDAAYDALVNYFGEMPPARSGTEFQMTGYLIRDDAIFREAKLVPDDLPPFEHGRHRRNEFWMREQNYDYYRRHLLIHEATHCFMTYMPDSDAPVWYLEGMAELFGTHRLHPDGSLTFREMPTSPEEFAGWGRITAIRTETADDRMLSIAQVTTLPPDSYLKPVAYAWCWGLCHFLDTHPRYRERFRGLGKHLQRTAFARKIAESFQDDTRDLDSEWMLFATNLRYSYDTSRAAMTFASGKPLENKRPVHTFDIAADRGWQSGGVLVEAGKTYEVTATGRFTLAESPKPWISEPQGISFRYFDGLPLGQLLACVRSESGPAGGATDSLRKVLPIGRGRRFQAPITGTLYLRINDGWDSLADNKGTVAVEVKLMEADSSSPLNK